MLRLYLFDTNTNNRKEHSMNTIIKITAASLVAAFALTGCAVQDTLATSDQKVTTVAPADLQSDSADYIDALNFLYPNWPTYGTESEAIEVGELVCDFYDDYGVEQTVLMTVQSGRGNVPDDLSYSMILAATDSLCPQYQPALDAWMNS